MIRFHRTLLLFPAICLLLSAQEPGADLTGKVVETMDSGGYTYVLLDKAGKRTWVAMPQGKVTVGAEMTFGPGSPMANFPSKTLNRTFDMIYFTSGPKGGGAAALPHPIPAETSKLPPGHPSTAAAGAESKAKVIKVPKAAGANAFTVAQLFAKGGPAAGKTVAVRGKVVKVSLGIMGKNWIHLQDGSGSAAKGNHNLVVTSSGTAAVGDVLTATGPLARDKDFGQGYFYAVLVEDASLKK